MDYGGQYGQRRAYQAPPPARPPLRDGRAERRRRAWRRVRRTLYVLLGLGMFLPVLAFVIAYFQVKVPDPSSLAQQLNQPVTLFYADGTPLYTKSTADAHALVTWDQIPQAMKNAQIAAEDETFMTNSGFDIQAILRTVYNRLTGGTGGGSTIGQEYVKNATGNDEATFTRKFTEMVQSYKMTRTYSKQDILTAYLNTVYFGRGAYGISAAARTYYNEDVSKLTTEQSALLAGLVQLPGQANNTAYQQRRYTYVMGRLLANHLITQAEFASAQFPAPLPATAKDGAPGLPPDRQYIVSQAFAELTAAGYDEQSLSAKGAKVYLTIKPDAQQKAEDSVNKVMAADKNYPDEGAALVSANPQTGEIVAYYGGDGSTSYDLATTPQQPGSSFKPYVFAAAVRTQPDKIGLNTLYDGSDNQTIAGQVVHNADGEGQPQMTVKDAMTQSVNTVFYRMGTDVGLTNVRQTAWDAGIPKKITSALGSTYDSLQNDAPDGTGTGTTEAGISIGQYPVRPLDQAQGYATFAAGGMTVPLHMVARVTDDSGGAIYGFTQTPKPAFGDDAQQSKDIASVVTASMTDVAQSSGDGLSDGRPNAAKTGTAQYMNSGHNSEAWMVGYTPQVVTAVWFGNKKQPSPIYGNYHNGHGKEKGYDVYGREEPGYIWQGFMSDYLKGQSVVPFPAAPDLTTPTAPPPPPSVPSTPEQPLPTTTEPPSSSEDKPSRPHGGPTQTCFPGYNCPGDPGAPGGPGGPGGPGDGQPTDTSVSRHHPVTG